MTNNKEYARKYYQEHKEEIIKRSCEWNRMHHEEHLKHAKKCAQNRKEKIEEWKREHPDYAKNYYQNNKDKMKKQMTEWRRAHPDKQREYAKNYRLKKKKGGLNG